MNEKLKFRFLGLVSHFSVVAVNFPNWSNWNHLFAVVLAILDLIIIGDDLAEVCDG